MMKVLVRMIICYPMSPSSILFATHPRDPERLHLNHRSSGRLKSAFGLKTGERPTLCFTTVADCHQNVLNVRIGPRQH